MKYYLTFLLLLAYITTNAQAIDLTLNYDNEDREYLLYLPANLSQVDPVPLVVALHGLTNSGSILFESSKFDLIADTANFIVVYPTALTNSLGQTAWNNGLLVGSGADDTGFIRELIQVISGEYNIDASRVYITGFSMGGFMSNRMACEFADEIAAIASHSGTIADPIHTDCSPSRPFPMMHIHGTSDFVVGYDGNWLVGFESVDTLMQFWRGHNDCPSTYTVTELEDIADDDLLIEKRVYGPCNDNIDLWLYTASNHGHAWLQPENDIFSSKEIWDFFSLYDLDGPVAVRPKVNEFQLAVFPNPVTDRLFLRSNHMDEIKSIHLYNKLGSLIKTIDPQATNIDVADLGAGLYFLRINQAFSFKFIKV